jgi:hypothetical protein
VKGFYSVSASSEPVASDGTCRSASIPAAGTDAPSASRPSFTSASHEALFQRDEATRCDACNERLTAADDSAGYSPQGRAIYLWQRGGEPQVESAPLCPSCASAIGVTALARWEIEEEEG